MADETRELKLKITTDRAQSQAEIAAEIAEIKKVGQARKKVAVDAAADEHKAQDAIRRESKATTAETTANLGKAKKALKDMADEAKKAGADVGHSLGKGTGEGGKGFRGLTDAVGLATKAMGPFFAAQAGFSLVKTMAADVAAQFDLIRKSAEATAKLSLTQRGDVRALAALEGNAGDTTKTELNISKVRQATGATREEVLRFRSAALGIGEAAITAGQISKEQADELMMLGQKQSVAVGTDAEAAGSFTMSLPAIIGGKGQKAEDVFRKSAQLGEIFRAGGPAESVLQSQFTSVAGSVGTLYQDPAQLAAQLSAFSTMRGEGAGDATMQLARATSARVLGDRGVKLFGVSKEEQVTTGEYYSKLGIGEGTKLNPSEIADRVATDIDEAEKRAKAEGRGFDPLQYLQGKGFGNQEEVSALNLYRSQREQFKGAFMPMTQQVPTMDESLEAFKTFKADRLGRQRFIEADVDAQAQIRGWENEAGAQAKQRGFANMQATGDAPAGATMEEFTSGFFGGAREQAIRDRATSLLGGKLAMDKGPSIGAAGELLQSAAGAMAPNWFGQKTRRDERLAQFAFQQEQNPNFVTKQGPSADPIAVLERIAKGVEAGQANQRKMQDAEEKKLAAPPPLRAPVKPNVAQNFGRP